jgi:hypothetical protein
VCTADLTPTDGTPPIFVSGSRVVDLRDTSGHLARYTTIPSTSFFATTGGLERQCSFTADADGVASDGQSFTVGQEVFSTGWLFVESDIISFGDYWTFDPQVNRGPLENAYRSFMVFCDSLDHFIGYAIVYPSDPMINPHTQLTTLYNGLQLEQPQVWRNPVVDRWGGLITRYPAWLAINASAWRTQPSNPVSWRGWLMYLYSTPVALDFHVEFTPDPASPSTAFDGFVPCIDRDAAAVAGGGAFPAFPELPELTKPGVNGPCMWTAPGPGSVTIQARITYKVTFWVSGYTEHLPDYEWSSPPATFRTGELSSVNTNG